MKDVFIYIFESLFDLFALECLPPLLDLFLRNYIRQNCYMF
jgi:hypothetical protein